MIELEWILCSFCLFKHHVMIDSCWLIHYLAGPYHAMTKFSILRTWLAWMGLLFVCFDLEKERKEKKLKGSLISAKSYQFVSNSLHTCIQVNSIKNEFKSTAILLQNYSKWAAFYTFQLRIWLYQRVIFFHFFLWATSNARFWISLFSSHVPLL